MIKLKRFFILMLGIAFAINSWAQESKITGTVKSAEDGNPIADVDIRVKGALEISSKTDNSGKFSIAVPVNSTNILIFSHLEFDVIETNIYGKSSVEIEMISSVRKNQYGQIVGRKVLSAEARDGFIAFESADKDYKLWFDNRVYLDGATYFDSYDDNLTQEQNLAEGRIDIPAQLLKLRRMRFAMKAEVGDNWYGEIDFDFDGNTVDIKDAYIRKSFGKPGSTWGLFRIGQFRMPQGMQTTTTSRYLKLMERASVGEFNPNRRLGIGFATWDKKYMFGLGLHTEEIRNIHDQFEGDPYYFKSPTPDNSISMQGAKPMLGISTRGAYYFMNETGKLIALGLGYSSRTPGLYKFPDYRVKYDPKDETNVSELEFTVAKVGGVKLATNINADAAFSFGPWRMTGEYYINRLALKTSEVVNFSGFYVQSAFLLTGENHPWNYREGEFTQVKAENKSGAWEVAARYSYINLNDFEQGVRGGQKGQYTVGLNYYASNNVKFMLNFSYVDHDMYSDGAGDYANYVSPTLTPTGLDYSMITWRCEVDF